MKKLIIPLCVLLLGIGSGAYLYASQKHKLDILQAQHKLLVSKLTAAKTAYNSTKASGVIKTDTWKQYCDPLAPFCMKYPRDWKVDGGVVDYGQDDKRNFISIVSPDKQVTVRYIDPLVKDGSSGSAHIVDTADVKLSGQTLKLVGSYPVSSGIYSPWYFYSDSNSSAGGTVGSIGHDLSSSIFDIGKYQALSLSASYSGSSKMTSEAQAKAWFQAIDGKTAKAILTSFGSK